jgi:hypothetical protein
MNLLNKRGTIENIVLLQNTFRRNWFFYQGGVKMKECDSCGGEAGKSEFNQTGDLCCQYCGDLLCEMCAVYGHDLLPRCEHCHFRHLDECEKCQGKGNCWFCDFAGYT